MFKKIIQISALIGAIVIATVAAIFLTKDNYQQVLLDATNFKESDTSKEFNRGRSLKNNYENSFLTRGYDNYSLYKYQEGQKSINDDGVEFSGNISSYNNVTNDAININLWKDDFSIVNLVIKTKDDFKDSKIKIDASTSDMELNLKGGFLRYVKATNNLVNPGQPSFYGVNKPLWIPDVETTDNDVDAVKDRVYIYRLRISRNNSDQSNERSTVNLKISSDDNVSEINDSKEIVVDKTNLSLSDEANKTYSSNSRYQAPGYDVLDYPNDISSYLNSQGGQFKMKSNLDFAPGLKEAVSKATNESFDINNVKQYVQYNFEKYWKPQFKNTHDNYNENNFLVEFTHDGNNLDQWEVNPNNPTKYLKSNAWADSGVGNSWYMWKADQEHDMKPYLNESDWGTFDWYVDQMGDLGFNHLQLNDLLNQEFYTSAFAVLENGVWKNKKITHDWESEKSIEFNKALVQSWLEHVKYLQNHKNVENNWLVNHKDMTVSFYCDEVKGETLKKITNIVDSLRDESTKQYMTVLAAYPTRWMDSKGKWVDQVKDADYLYIYLNSLYDDQNKNAKKLIEERNKLGLVTGQYQLDSTASFDLARCEPGTLTYEMLQLSKQHEPNYLKYRALAINSKPDKDGNIPAYNTSDYYESYSPYVSGDTMWEYPTIQKYEGYSYEVNNELPTDISTRTDGLAQGINLVKKEDILDSLNLINKDELNKVIEPVMTGSRIQSANIFNFADENDLPIHVQYEGFANSYTKNYLDGIKGKYGQVDAVRWIEVQMNKASKLFKGDK